MEKLFEELDYRQTPLGDLILQRRRYLQLNNQVVYEVKLGDAFLMSSLFHVVEEALANLGLDALADGTEADVVVGGLGLGYTAVEALCHPSLHSLIVVDALEAVIEWHRQGLVPLGARLAEDPRCRFVNGDFFKLAAEPSRGFDPEEPGRKFHAVLLDIDHSPRNLLSAGNARFYQKEGLEKLAAQLHHGGIFALWSDDPPDGDFLADLRAVFASAESHIVPFPNPLLGKESESTVYVAVRG
jgi:spermidine synthase